MPTSEYFFTTKLTSNPLHSSPLMALAKDPIETCAYNLKFDGEDLSSLQPYNCEEANNNNSKLKKLSMSTHSTTSPSLGSPSSANSNNEFVFRAAGNNQTEEVHSLMNFRGSFNSHCNGSFLSFNGKDHHGNHYSNWDGNVNYSYQLNPKCNGSDPRLVEDFNCFQTASNFRSSAIPPGDENIGNWLYSEDQADCIQEPRAQEAPSQNKRSSMDENLAGGKKQCTTASRKPKAKTPSSSPSAAKDPQSIAAKIRRERISERLKVLQDLVPNGSKVDLVTMLEKAISYVKFLQLQVKVLATDEFWPVQGGKAPDISQVKEAIDAILSSHKDRNSSSSSKQ